MFYNFYVLRRNISSSSIAFLPKWSKRSDDKHIEKSSSSICIYTQTLILRFSYIVSSYFFPECNLDTSTWKALQLWVEESLHSWNVRWRAIEGFSQDNPNLEAIRSSDSSSPPARDRKSESHALEIISRKFAPTREIIPASEGWTKASMKGEEGARRRGLVFFSPFFFLSFFVRRTRRAVIRAIIQLAWRI